MAWTIVTFGNGTVSISQDGKELTVDTFLRTGENSFEATFGEVEFKFHEDTDEGWRSFWKLTDPGTKWRAR